MEAMHRGFCSPEFEAATDYVQLQVQLGESRFSEATLQLEFYGLYKQSLCGPVIDKQPSIFQIKERAKWNAWKTVSELSQEEAQQKYVELVYETNPQWTEGINGAQRGVSIGGVFSRPSGNLYDGLNHPNPDPSPSKRVYSELVDQNYDLKKWKAKLKVAGLSANDSDDKKRTAMHWAADFGDCRAIDVLYEAGLSVKAPDEERMTPLHYTALCEHREVTIVFEKGVGMLLQAAKKLERYGAQWNVPDASGSTPHDFAPMEWN